MRPASVFTMKRRDLHVFLPAFWLLVSALLSSHPAAAITLPTPPKNAPNIVIVLLDDVGYRTGTVRKPTTS